ncbi:hypothetical protein P5G65_23765 [Paenibacillus chondroitinus]|uniref:Helix-turn-helix domain-containing protein n=1 Tax=Paenibacillus chondroitinus TaxID=59842 RepID=A0ABU6DJC8_9BACL|nr:MULTISPECIES: hypothetical protein [Paenibacillus]MCY9659527.1 hypothetical protein [Paenibacillus anseongense]MEB4796922.1 hypothetical protein [Paenibacillus chondroitinus]
MNNLITVAQACAKYEVTDYMIIKLIKEGKIPSATKGTTGYTFSETELVKAAALDYVSLEKAVVELGLTNKKQVYHLVKTKEIGAIIGPAGRTLISKEELERYKLFKQKIDSMLITADIAERLGVDVKYINQITVYGKIVPELKYQGIWYFTEQELERYQNTILDREKFLSVEETSVRLSKTAEQVRVLIRNGTFECVKYKTLLYIPIEAIEDYETFISLTTPHELFMYHFKKMIVPDYLQKTFLLHGDYAFTRLNTHKQSPEKMKSYVHKLLKIAELFKLLLTKEIIEYNDKQLELILKNDLFISSDIDVIAGFLTYCQGTTDCKFKNTYTIVKKKHYEQEIYSPDEFYAFYLYVRDFEKLTHKALERRRISVMWVYILMHLIDAWRHSDILTKLPAIPIEVIEMDSIDKFKPLSEEQAQLLINHVFSRIERMTISKTGALGHFLVHGDMIIPTATALTIAEMHRRKANDKILMRLFETSEGRKVDKEMHLQPFFGEREDLMIFQSRKMNRSLLTYFFYSVVEGKKHSDIAYELSQRLRGHTDIDSTVTYIKSTNKDGSINRVSLNLVNRGHFGWLYNFIIQTYLDPTNSQSLEERTQSIVALKDDFTPSQIENVSGFMVRRQQEKESLALRIARMPREELELLLYRISRGEMPAKMPHAQCVIHPQCSKPRAVSCLDCENIIPQNYLLISIKEEVSRLVHSINSTKYHGVIVRDYYILKLVLELLKQAVQQFGKEYVGTFLDLKQLKQDLLVVDDRFKIMGELLSDN